MNRDSMKFESVPVKRKLSNVEHKISNNQDASSKVSCGSVSSVESIASFANPNFGTGSDEELGFTSDSDVEEHPYSASKKIKLSEPGTSSNRSLGIGLSVSSRLNNCNLSLRDSKSYNTNDEFSCNVAFSSRHRPRPKRQSKCNSKNAVMARMNRLKKKKFIEDLEARNQQLEAESKILKRDLRSRLEVIGKLRRETLYLRSVIKNSPEIGKLLQCIHKNTNLKIGSSLLNSFKAEPDSTETSNHETTFPTRSPGQDSSKTAGAESEEGNLAKEILDDNLNGELNLDFNSSFLSDFEIPSENFNEPSLSPSLDFGYPEFDPSVLMRCETPSNGISSNEANDPLFGDVGICFHVANSKVSLEFCESCNFKASLENNLG